MASDGSKKACGNVTQVTNDAGTVAVVLAILKAQGFNVEGMLAERSLPPPVASAPPNACFEKGKTGGGSVTGAGDSPAKEGGDDTSSRRKAKRTASVVKGSVKKKAKTDTPLSSIRKSARVAKGSVKVKTDPGSKTAGKATSPVC